MHGLTNSSTICRRISVGRFKNGLDLERGLIGEVSDVSVWQRSSEFMVRAVLAFSGTMFLLWMIFESGDLNV